jgi:hypothetical protein
MFKEANYYPLHALLAFNYKSKTSTPPELSDFLITYGLSGTVLLLFKRCVQRKHRFRRALCTSQYHRHELHAGH